MAGRVRIGAVAYLNTRPLVYGLENGSAGARIELSYDVPSRLAERMRAGELDIALLPIVEYARIPDLEIVPGLGITTRGPSRSVLLVTRKPIEQIETVALDPESRTSNVLVQVLLHRIWQRQPRFVPGPRDRDSALESADAVVRIGDKALFELPPQGSEVYDLGDVWTHGTGLPFVFAAWIARPGCVDREIYQALHDARRAGGRNIEHIANEYSFEGHRDPQVAREYLEQNIHFRLGGVEHQAMRLFFKAAAELELIEAAPQLRMALTRQTRCHESAEELRGFPCP